MLQKKKFPYLDRDISWMFFNRRILQEACRTHVPLLERMSFLGIYSNNLDEFFRVRMASQSRIAECTDKTAAKESEHAKKLLKQITNLNARYVKEYGEAVINITEDLRKENIYLIPDTDISEGQKDFIYSFYKSKLNGNIVPVWFSAVKSLDFGNDENIYLAVKVGKDANRHLNDYAFLELPVSTCWRFVRLPDEGCKRFLMYLDDVIRCCLPLVFEGLGYTHFEAYAYKFTRDAEMEIDNDPNSGTLQKILKGVRSRKHGEPLRVIYDEHMPKDLLKRVLKKLEVDKNDTVIASGRYQNHKDFMHFPDCDRTDLKYPAWTPILRKSLDGPDSLLQKIQKQDRFIHVPYHNFDSFIRVLQEAAVSKQVTGIKITLYRLAKESKVVKALIAAARNGKKVTVVIELLARFDEASNVSWSKKMQDAGIRVIFGVEGLKVHSKITHIGMRTGSDIACISSGNFHEGNARIYTDCMLMTASQRLVKDVNTVFDFIERPYVPVKFKELLVSPNEMRNKFITLIRDEIKNRKAGKPAYIKIKINHITDPVMVAKLYEASEAGVDISLTVRGNCSLMTDVPGISNRIRINGIIDRYLEHSRIFVFAAGGAEKVFIGSADWMPRNLDNRVEVITPIYDPRIKEEMKRVVDYALKDTLQGRIVDGTGDNKFHTITGEKPFRSQEALYNYYVSKNKEEE